MQKSRFVQNATIIALGVAIIIMSVGYAAYQSQLTVTGSAKVQSANWDVHFGTPTETKSAGVTAYDGGAVTITEQTTNSVKFKVKMAIGDSYSVSIPVINGGTFNAKLDSFSLTGTLNSTDLKNDISGATYNGRVLHFDAKMGTNALAANNEATNLDANTTKNLIVKLEAVQPTIAEGEDVNTVLGQYTGDSNEYEFTLTLNYNQRTA